MSKPARTAIPALTLALSICGAQASPLFADDAVLELSLTGPLHSLLGQKDDGEELPFSLTAEGIEHAIGVRLRGKSRQRVCDFPPLRLNFARKNTHDSVFAGQNKLKLVTHCNPGERAQAALLGEYAAYRIFNYLTPVAYRVRLLRITYTDTERRLRPETTTNYGFVIESAGEFSKRVDGTAVEVPGVRLGSLDPQHTALVFVFQYLIGNTDWSLVAADGDDACCHNGNLFDIGQQRYYIPYDFDLSGLANASYARPDPSLRLSKVTQRLYRGYCVPGLPLAEALSSIRSQRDQIVATVREAPGLPDKPAKKKTRYLERFYDRAEDPAKLVRSFEKKCL